MGFPRLTSAWIQLRITDHCDGSLPESGPAATPGSPYSTPRQKLKEMFNMEVRAHNARRLSITLAVLIGTSGIALAQEAQIAPGSERPMFTVLKPALHAP